jgi:hypothetical protein
VIGRPRRSRTLSGADSKPLPVRCVRCILSLQDPREVFAVTGLASGARPGTYNSTHSRVRHGTYDVAIRSPPTRREADAHAEAARASGSALVRLPGWWGIRANLLIRKEHSIQGQAGRPGCQSIGNRCCPMPYPRMRGSHHLMGVLRLDRESPYLGTARKRLFLGRPHTRHNFPLADNGATTETPNRWNLFRLETSIQPPAFGKPDAFIAARQTE